jgi:dipeptidyl aminopeptidase/acylaminoacyl peptidase
MEIAYRQIGDPRTEEGKALLKERSPLTHVDKIKIPLLIAHGEKDPRVKQAESDQIVSAMKAKNTPHIYMLFMDEGHGFARPENRFGFFSVAEYFLAEHLGGRFEKITTELDLTTLDPTQKEALKAQFTK